MGVGGVRPRLACCTGSDNGKTRTIEMSTDSR